MLFDIIWIMYRKCIMSSALCLTAALLAAAHTNVMVRLADGPTSAEGRVEVLYQGKWGTVCDDEWDNNKNKGCTIVCKQLGFSDGKHRKYAAEVYGEGTGDILLDDVKCDGDETNIGQCLHSFWNVTDCKHNEDVGCMCTTAPTAGNGVCDPSRHRITPFSQKYEYRGIGRAEIEEDGVWYTVCDDHWDDVNAAVFCSCWGQFPDPQFYKAYWSDEIRGLLPNLEHKYDKIECDGNDTSSLKNIWDCQTELSSEGRCKAGVEAAAVACQNIPRKAPPSVEMVCDGHDMTVCFKSSAYEMSSNFLSLSPSCSQQAAVRRNVTDRVCMDIHMDECESKDISTDHSFKHYCYDIHYSQFDSDSDQLLTDVVWTRKACCSVEKNGTVVGSFLPSNREIHSTQYDQAPVNFTIKCYEDDDFSGAPLACPANITRGQEVYCKVSADVWDPRMKLVVPNCKFLPKANGQPEYTFIKDKCPNTPGLDLKYYGLDSHNWGFKFMVPKFQGHETLYLACDCYLCDYILDDKPYCDRSCLADGTRRRRDLTTTGIIFDAETIEIKEGPFYVTDAGFGPIISKGGTLHSLKMKEGPAYATDSRHDSGMTRDISSSSGLPSLCNTLVFLITVLIVNLFIMV